ncbi:Phosphoglycolate phosphatase [bioreactor metagenome]|uniref:Phosphoglycolate phosphatase n=1 Tax=bioreactor metagenome TaxID=1076179 RepID=A0A645CDA2_9ZZZZ|nr:HAD family hydrolase [Erysipelotrichaceae bacterium]
MYQAVIFDLDGTLLNTIDDLANAGNYALVELGLPIHKSEKYKKMVGYGKAKLMESILPDGMSGCISIASQLFDSYYLRHMLDATVEYSGISELLASLHDQKVKLAVLTNKPHHFAKEMINHYFPYFFDYVIGTGPDTKTKPDPDSLLGLIKQFNLNPEEVLYVGDSEVDVMTGQNAHVDTVSVLWGFRDKPELEALKPTYLVNHAGELAEIVLKR